MAEVLFNQHVRVRRLAPAVASTSSVCEKVYNFKLERSSSSTKGKVGVDCP